MYEKLSDNYTQWLKTESFSSKIGSNARTTAFTTSIQHCSVKFWPEQYTRKIKGIKIEKEAISLPVCY